MGNYGLFGWRKQAQGFEYTEVIVGRSIWRKAVDAIGTVIPKLKACEVSDAVELRHVVKENIVAKIVRPLRQPYAEVMKNTESVDGERLHYRIPTLEMALALTFAEMTDEDAWGGGRLQAAHDFVCIVEANEQIDEENLKRLASLISPKTAKDIVMRIRADST